MGLACVMQMERSSALTVSLSVDFLSIGRIGQWFEVRAVPAKLGRALAFADARIEVEGEMIAKAAATFASSKLHRRLPELCNPLFTLPPRWQLAIPLGHGGGNLPILKPVIRRRSEDQQSLGRLQTVRLR